MSLLRVFLVAGVLAVPLLPAIAADMPGNSPRELPLPSFERPRLRLLENSGWYLRGDLGYAIGRIDSAESPPGIANPTANSLGSGMTGGFGAGIKSTWLRTDVTIDYLSPLKYQGTIATPGDVTAKVSAWSFLFSGYFDLGTWYRVTPYISGGVGAANVHISDYANAALPASNGLSSSQWNFAWAAAAGLGYAVSPNMMVDVGYRYLNLGDAKSGSDASGHMTFKKFAAHEVRVGIRWSFDDLPVQR